MYRVVTLFCIATVVLSAHLPPDIHTCQVSDQDCLKSSAEKAFATLATGYKELNIPPLDPLSMGTLTVEQKPGPINIFQKFNDIVVTGLSKAKVRHFTINLKDCFIQVELLVPNLETTSSYIFKGQLLLFPIDAEGDAVAKFKDYSMEANATCEVIQKQDVQNIHITSTTMTFNPREFEFHLGPLIKGNEQLDKVVHKVIDDDPMALLGLIKTAAEGVFSTFLKEIINDVTMKIPMNELFKE